MLLFPLELFLFAADLVTYPILVGGLEDGADAGLELELRDEAEAGIENSVEEEFGRDGGGLSDGCGEGAPDEVEGEESLAELPVVRV
jgi:hypothetical protein